MKSNSELGYICLCPKHLTGEKCKLLKRTGVCRSGWYSALASGGADGASVGSAGDVASTPSNCGPCRCDTSRGFSSICHSTTGRCKCRPDHYAVTTPTSGYHAPSADPIVVCVPCRCEPIGSLSLSCSNDGQCNCVAGVLGRRCNKCSSASAEILSTGDTPTSGLDTPTSGLDTPAFTDFDFASLVDNSEQATPPAKLRPPPPQLLSTGDESSCRVIYDACPRQFSDEIWWPRASFGDELRAECPSSYSIGVATRLCTSVSLWHTVDLSRCLARRFSTLANKLSQIEHGKLEVIYSIVLFINIF